MARMVRIELSSLSPLAHPRPSGTPLAHVYVNVLPCSSESTTSSLHSDAGKKSPSSWVEAVLKSAEPVEGKNYAWTLWKARVEIPGNFDGEKEVALVAFCGEVFRPAAVGELS